MERSAAMRIGVVIERRPSGSIWQDWSWYPAAVIPATGDRKPHRTLRSGQGEAFFHGGERTIELHRGETDAYKQNLSLDTPVVYVALRPAADPGAECAVTAFHVTVSPDEAQAYVEGDDAVHPVAMPGFVGEWVARFVEAHHQDTPFERRKRKGGGAGAHGTVPEASAAPIVRPAWKVPSGNG